MMSLSYAQTVARNPSARPADLNDAFLAGWEVVTNPDADSHPDTPEWQRVLATIASNPNATPSILAHLSWDYSHEVANNPALQLLSLEDPSLLGQFAPATTQAIRQHHDPEIRGMARMVARYQYVGETDAHRIPITELRIFQNDHVELALGPSPRATRFPNTQLFRDLETALRFAWQMSWPSSSITEVNSDILQDTHYWRKLPTQESVRGRMLGLLQEAR